MKHQPVRQGQATTPETTCPTLCDKFVGSLTSLAKHVTEDAGDRACGLIFCMDDSRLHVHLLEPVAQ